MAKNLVAKTGEYTNQQGETKGQYSRVGVLMDSNDGGQYLLLDPTINLAGCLQKQNMMNHKAGKQTRDSLMVSIFDSQQQGQAQGKPQQQQQGQQQQGYSQQQPEEELPF